MAARSQQSPGIRKTLIRLALWVCSGEGGVLGTTWDSLGEEPFISLGLQKRPRNLGKPAPVLIARACLGLQEGGAGAVPNGAGMGNHNGKNTQNPARGPTQCSLADVCSGGSIHDELGV